ncbi:MAG: peptidoglycan/xylan/chitin deacetylase (PgdA/CDA1 family) [Verrucomicrobiales bacterium]|jgi:peptidoglycan/xylan/chitin deacetylase (PgdA/CDA1 family)
MSKPKAKPLASLSLDLDNLWSYMKTHGDAGWESLPSYFDLVVPRILAMLETFDQKITFFVVGKDAEQPKNLGPLRAIANSGHEIGNHSLWHEPAFNTYNHIKTHTEVTHAEKAIEEAIGVKPRGWRGPGFSYSRDLLEILADRGYEYDASTFPTFLGPIARIFYFLKSGLKKADREKRKDLYGGWLDGFRTLKPFHWDLSDDQQLLEIPVTTMPFFKTPIHASYLLYLAKFSPKLARLYFKMALALCKLTRTAPSFLLHPTDFLGKEDVPELHYFPAMDQTSAWKLGVLRQFLGMLTSKFDVLPMSEYAKAFKESKAAKKRPKSAPEKGLTLVKITNLETTANS